MTDIDKKANAMRLLGEMWPHSKDYSNGELLAILIDRERLQSLVAEAREILIHTRGLPDTQAVIDDWLARTAPKPKEQS